MTIRRRIIFWFTLFVGLLLVVSNLVSWLAMRDHLRQLAMREAKAKTTKVQEVINTLAYKQEKYTSSDFTLDSPKILSDILQELFKDMLDHDGIHMAGGAFLQLRNNDGEVLTRSPNLGSFNLPLLKPGKFSMRTIAVPNQAQLPVLCYATDLYIQQQPIGRVQVAVSLIEKNYILAQLLWSRLLSILFALICASGLGYILSRQLLRPMVQITEQVRLMIDTEKLTSLDTSQIPPDEVNRLAETFNQLLERISATMVQQQRFISDASHELRSPLTSIRGHAELLLKRGRDNPAILDEGLQIIVRESERLTRLTEDLLLLAHSRKQQLTLERINLVPLIQQVVASMRALHPHLRLRGKDTELWIEGNSDAFKRILINLVDNALRATHQGKVTIGWRKLEDGICEVYVEDNGAGIPTPSLPHLFERFYRVESARERNKGGAGLGLAIVKELVDWHRGTIRVNSEVAKGSCFIITLPLSPHEA